MAVGLAFGMMATGVALDTLGQYNQGRALKQQAEAEKDILDFNAQIKDREAKAALDRARAEAAVFQREGEELQGRQQVALAKGGVLTSTGTPMFVMEDTARELEADRMSILREGFLAQSTKEQEAEGLRFEGRAARARGRNLKLGSDLRTATTGLSGARSLLTTFAGVG